MWNFIMNEASCWGYKHNYTYILLLRSSWPSKKRGTYESKVVSPIINRCQQSAFGMPHTVLGRQRKDFTEDALASGSCRMKNSLVSTVTREEILSRRIIMYASLELCKHRFFFKCHWFKTVMSWKEGLWLNLLCNWMWVIVWSIFHQMKSEAKRRN